MARGAGAPPSGDGTSPQVPWGACCGGGHNTRIWSRPKSGACLDEIRSGGACPPDKGDGASPQAPWGACCGGGHNTRIWSRPKSGACLDEIRSGGACPPDKGAVAPSKYGCVVLTGSHFSIQQRSWIVMQEARMQGDRQDGRARIKVIGAGGGGGNAVNRMISAALKGVEFIAINTDLQALERCNADVKVNIGRKLTRGLGSGGDWTKGRDAADESSAELT